MEPKVSVCIPVYKQKELLKQALDSVLMQSYSDFEVVITDDTPGDEIKQFLEDNYNNARIKYHKNPAALGSPANWNKAMSFASGEYIKILHHDDFFTSTESLGKYVKLLDDNKRADFAFSGTLINLVKEGMRKKYFCTSSDFEKMKAEPEILLKKNYIGAPSATIIRKSALQEFDEDLKWLVDIDWYVRLLKKNAAIVYTKELLICTVHGSEGQVTQEVSGSREIQVREHVLVLQKFVESGTDVKKFSVLFQLLFNKFAVHTIGDLKRIVEVPAELENFLSKVFREKNKSTFLKKVNHWSSKYTFNDLMYVIKRKLK